MCAVEVFKKSSISSVLCNNRGNMTPVKTVSLVCFLCGTLLVVAFFKSLVAGVSLVLFTKKRK